LLLRRTRATAHGGVPTTGMMNSMVVGTPSACSSSSPAPPSQIAARLLLLIVTAQLGCVREGAEPTAVPYPSNRVRVGHRQRALPAPRACTIAMRKIPSLKFLGTGQPAGWRGFARHWLSLALSHTGPCFHTPATNDGWGIRNATTPSQRGVPPLPRRPAPTTERVAHTRGGLRRGHAHCPQRHVE
jgi:hypothetical protein